jgi:hypothetical protein
MSGGIWGTGLTTEEGKHSIWDQTVIESCRLPSPPIEGILAFANFYIRA